MNKHRAKSMARLNLYVLIAIGCVLAVNAGPLLHHAARGKREIYPEIMDDQPLGVVEKLPDEQSQVCVVGDLVYEIDELVPAEQPCLKCKCQPPGVHCEATRCEKKPGCRAIHKPNACCPEYQCECEYEGRTYANGERLEQKAGTECKVCYCRGGEVQCAEVSCYIRNDCEGRHVPGKCCPKYDHCPPKEPSNIFFANEINDTTTQKQQVYDYREHHQHHEDHPEITIQEIIPEIKEIPITNSPKREINEVVHIPSRPQETEVESADAFEPTSVSNDLHVPDSETDGSEVAEVYQQPPPVLRIGDKLLFLKKNGQLVPEVGASTPATVITIIGAEGLQRGGIEPEESVENHDSPKQDNRTVGDEDEPVEDEDDIQTVAESSYILSLVKPRSSTTEVPDFGDAFNVTELEFEEEQSNATRSLNNSPWEDGSTTDGVLSSTADSDQSSKEISATQPSTGALSSSISPIEKDEVIIESNPEYPPIPDVMTQQVEEIDAHHVDHPSPATKIVPEVQDLNANHPNSTNNTSWLKNTLLNPAAVLPDSILSSVAESDLRTETPEDEPTTPGIVLDTSSSASTVVSSTSVIMDTSETSTQESLTSSSIEMSSTNTIELTTLETPKPSRESMESLEEDQESGEKVTPVHDHASILNDESNASVEDLTPTKTTTSLDTNTSELVEIMPGFENMTRESVEVSSAKPQVPKPEDVEMIDVDLMRGHHSDEEAKNATHEGIFPLFPQPEKQKIPERKTTTVPTKTISKEESNGKDKKLDKRESSEDDAIFEELNREIGLETGTITERTSKEQDEAEAKEIFMELLDEATSNTTKKPISLQGKKPETRAQQQQAQALEKIGDALAKLKLKDSRKSAFGSPIDLNVLGILRDFFTAQYRAYN